MNKELSDKFSTKESIKEELKRITPIKKKYRTLALWGNIEAKESWRKCCKYEKQLKEILNNLK